MDKIITYSFCEAFLDNLADYLNRNYIKQGNDLSRLAIVFGGKRPALFLKRELAGRIGSVFYPPQFFTINEFIACILKKKEAFTPAVDMDNCYLLYELAKRDAPQILNGREAFAEFLPWTREIISFIDQLDLEGVEDASLKNIEANAQIGYSVPQDINRLLEAIVILRKNYHKELKEKKCYSRGLQYLRAAQVVDEVSFDEFDQILFCNFFYFNRTGEKVVRSLYSRGKATLIFQGDERKWPVLKKISKSFNCRIREGDKPRRPEFKLNLHRGFDAHSQAGLVREILKGIKEPNRTVVVLPDPGNIIPLLTEIAGMDYTFNVSMGYPLRRSSLYTLFEFIFKAQLSRKGCRYYAKDYLKVILHPFVKNLELSAGVEASRTIVYKIEEILTGKEKAGISGSLFIDLQDIVGLDELYMLVEERLGQIGIKFERRSLQAILEEMHRVLFREWEDVGTFRDFSGVVESFLDILVHKSFLKNYPFNINIATSIYAIKDEFYSASFSTEPFPKEEIFKIFDSKVSGEMVRFNGSPLKGMQILGLEETRSLNFENVIIMDVNEGILPSLNIYEPLIPREVMISLNLDRLELEEEIQRYQFMRLISSAKNVHLVYQESRDKEKSRFIEELIWEEQKLADSILPVAPVARASFKVSVNREKKTAKKTPEMIKFLREFTYSASSLGVYLNDTMEFYYNYVLGVREEEDLLDEPDARHVGIFVHDLLEDAFKPFLKKKPEIDDRFREYFFKIFEKKFKNAFTYRMGSSAFLLKTVLIERLKRFLDNEQYNPERNVEEIICLEQGFYEAIPLSAGAIKFKYVVDRIDRMRGGTIMIIDYKTGSTGLMPKDIEVVAGMELSRESIRDNVRSFQVPLYFYCQDKQFKGKLINAALYNLRTLDMHKLIDKKKRHDPEQINAAFLRSLDFIINEILNPEVDFIKS